MSATVDLLNRYKDFHHLPSDYAAAKKLGLSRQAISNWRTGTHTMDDATALLVAQDIGADPLATLAAVHLERQPAARERRIWERYCARIFVATLVTLAGAWGGPPHAQASNIIPRVGYAIMSEQFDSLYIMRTIGWLRRRTPRRSPQPPTTC
jgi:transcriptional regulator with XRE-family HTH domain